MVSQGSGEEGKSRRREGPPRPKSVPKSSEVMGKRNLTRDAMERVTEELVMMTESWVPASGRHPETPPGLWG